MRSVRLLGCAHRLPIGRVRNRKVPPQRIQSCLGSSAREGSSVGAWCCAMIAPKDAFSVAQLKAAGAIILGKANMLR